MTTLAERALRYDREHARSLRALAYRMLGSRAEAEDIVQEAWLRWANVDESTVQHAGAYLSRLVTNLCLDKLGSAAAKREQYVGVWLPEPLLNEEAGWSPGCHRWSGRPSYCTTCSTWTSTRSGGAWSAARPPAASWPAAHATV